MDSGKREGSLKSTTVASTSKTEARTRSDDDVVVLENEEDSNSASNNDDFSLSSESGKKPYTPTTRARKRDIEDHEKIEARKRRKVVKEEAAMKVHELQVEKMDTMLEMLSSYKQDTNFIITKMNLLGANIGELPSEKNEQKLLKDLNALDTLQESIMQNSGEPSTLVNATSTRAQPPKEPSTRAQPPNSLKKTGENEFEKVTNSKTIAPVVDTINVTKDEAITEMDPTIEETEENAVVQLTGEDLRISRLSEEELGNEALALFNEMRFEDAKQLYERHKRLNQK